MEDLPALANLAGVLLGDPRTGPLIALLAVAAVVDARSNRIPNWLTAGGMAYALAVGAVQGASAWRGLGLAAAGLGVGLSVLLPLYILRVLGAGDVKLMGMVGAFLGPGHAALAALYAMAASGIVALAWVAWSGAGRQLFENLRFLASMLLTPGAAVGAPGGWRLQASGRLPCALAIFAGTLVFLAQHPSA